MEVILKEDVKSLGRVGDVVRVKEGYARNFLFPKKKAMPVTPGNLKQLDALKKQREARLAKDKATAEDVAAKLAKVVCAISKKAGEEGKIFGSVTAAEIADNLAEQGVMVDKKKIEFSEPIKHMGDFTASVALHPDVVAEIRISVVEEK